MSILIACPQCQAQLSLPDDAHQRKVRCPQCAELFVYDPHAASISAGPRAPSYSPPPEPMVERATWPDPAIPIARSPLPWILGTAVVVLLVVGAGGMTLWSIVQDRLAEADRARLAAVQKAEEALKKAEAAGKRIEIVQQPHQFVMPNLVLHDLLKGQQDLGMINKDMRNAIANLNKGGFALDPVAVAHEKRLKEDKERAREAALFPPPNQREPVRQVPAEMVKQLEPNQQEGALGPQSPIWKQIDFLRNAKIRIRSQAQFGKPGGDAFDDIPDEPAVLIGFYCDPANAMRYFQPIYLTPKGERLGKAFGTPGKVVSCAKAKDGYAVGKLVIRAGDQLDGFGVVFMKATNHGVDLNHFYASTWIGGQGQRAFAVGGQGSYLVGIHGRHLAAADKAPDRGTIATFACIALDPRDLAIPVNAP